MTKLLFKQWFLLKLKLVILETMWLLACEQTLLFGRVKQVSRERARLASLAQIGELARRLCDSLRWSASFHPWWLLLNTGTPFPSSSGPLYQNEVRFHVKGWPPNLVLIQRPGGTRKWPISLRPSIWLTDWRQGQGPSSTVIKALCARGFFSWLRRSCRVGLRPTKLLVAREKQPLVPRVTGHYKDLTETGNRARKLSGTQGKGSVVGA